MLVACPPRKTLVRRSSITEAINQEDQQLINAATEVIRRNYKNPRHTVGSAVVCGSGKIYSGVNVESCGYGPCAEPIAVGTAISNGEQEFKKIVAVRAKGEVISPCGNCRQLLVDHAPNIEVILPHGGNVMRTIITTLLPDGQAILNEKTARNNKTRSVGLH